ncbi:MAG: hypothetical protein ACI3YB_04550 [Prevotella sp.]
MIKAKTKMLPALLTHKNDDVNRPVILITSSTRNNMTAYNNMNKEDDPTL